MKNEFSPRTLESLTPQQRTKALKSLFLMEKQNGTIKSQICVDERKQWEELGKDEVASPTVIMDLLIMAAIEANETCN